MWNLPGYDRDFLYKNSFAKINIESQIKKIENRIANNDAFRENALQLKRETIQKKKYKTFLETIRKMSCVSANF